MFPLSDAALSLSLYKIVLLLTAYSYMHVKVPRDFASFIIRYVVNMKWDKQK